MKRILHLRASNFVGEPERQLLHHAQAQRGSGWQILIGTFAGPHEGHDLIGHGQALGVEMVALPTGSLKAVFETTKAIRTGRIDLLCTHGYKADIVGILAARISRVPVACFLRGWTGENSIVKTYEQLDRWSLRFADRVVCLSDSQATKLAIISGLSAKIRVVCNAITLEDSGESRDQARTELRNRLGLPQDSTIVATAGRLSPEKGVPDFIDAVRELADEFPAVKFVVFGEGVLRRRLEDQAGTLLDDHLMFGGFHPDLPRLLSGIDLLANPSHSEEMPNIVLEAMGCHVPVVATEVGAVAEIAGVEHAVRLVPAHNVQALARGMRELLLNPDEARRLGEAGHQRVYSAYSLTAQQRQFESLYEELLTSAARVPPLDGSTARRNLDSTSSLNSAQEKPPRVSVVIPVRNEEAHIESLLTQIERQLYPKECVEVLIVDGNSTDRTCQIVKEFADKSSLSVRLLPNPAQLSSAGRNVGIAAASGEYILFVDGHCWIPTNHLLVEMVRLFKDTDAACLCRPQPLSHPQNDNFQDVVANVRSSIFGHGSDSAIYNLTYEGEVNPSSSGAMYRKSVFGTVGFHDETFDACEDVELNFRIFQAGLKSYSSPKLAIHYSPRSSPLSLWKQMMRYGRGRFRLITKHRRALSLGQLVPAVFAVWIAAGAGASMIWPLFRSVYAASLVLYLLILIGSSVHLARRHGWRHLVWAPVVYFVIHAGLGVGFLAELATRIGRTLRKWQSLDRLTEGQSTLEH